MHGFSISGRFWTLLLLWFCESNRASSTIKVLRIGKLTNRSTTIFKISSLVSLLWLFKSSFTFSTPKVMLDLKFRHCRAIFLENSGISGFLRFLKCKFISSTFKGWLRRPMGNRTTVVLDHFDLPNCFIEKGKWQCSAMVYFERAYAVNQRLDNGIVLFWF